MLILPIPVYAQRYAYEWAFVIISGFVVPELLTIPSSGSRKTSLPVRVGVLFAY